jgi:hypothetical protein
VNWRRRAGIWTVVLGGIWVFLSFATADTEEECRRRDALICFELKETLWVWGLVIGGIWLLGLLITLIIFALVRWHRFLTGTESAASCSPDPRRLVDRRRPGPTVSRAVAAGV